MTEENITENVTTTGGCDPIINGTVTIEEYGRTRALPNATVTVSSTSDRILGMATTDENGYYSISFFSADTIFKVTASYIGCDSVTNSSVFVTLNLTDNTAYGTADFLLTPIEAEYIGLGRYSSVYMKYYNDYGAAGVMRVRIPADGGTTYNAFCIDIYTPISSGNTLLVNGPLPGTAGDLPEGVDWGKVNYILTHYVNNYLSNNEAAAIQCAIWYYTSAPYGVYPGNNSEHPGYYQFMTYSPRYISGLRAPYDGVMEGWWNYDYTVYNRAWQIIDDAESINYPSQISIDPETVRVPNGGSTTLTTTVTDQEGNPMSGVTVNFSTTSGSFSSSSSVTTTTATTNSNGQATVTIYGRYSYNTSATVLTWVQLQKYGTLLYDDYLNPKQNLVVADMVPYTLQAISIVNFDVTANVALSQNSTTPVNVGDTVTYVVTATNNGPNTATGILISDIVPAELSNITITPSNGAQYYNSNTGVWTIASLANGASATLTITGTATAAMAGLNTTNTATRIAQDQYNSLSNTTSAVVYTKLSDPIITQTVNSQDTGSVTVNVGDNVTIIVNAYCSGPDDATNIQIEDIIPVGLENVTVIPSVGIYDYNTGIWTIDFLEKFTNATLTIAGQAGAAMAGINITNHAEEIYQTEYNPTPGNSTSIPVYTKLADVTLTQTGSYLSDVVTFIVTATNNGPDTATNINIEDIISAGLTGVTVTPSAGTSYADGVWTIPSLAYLASATLNITGTATPQTTVTNTANKTTQSEYDPNTPDISTVNVYVPCVNMYVLQYPWYYDTKAGTYQTKSAYHNTIVYTVDVRNIGPDDASGIIIKEIIGTGYEFLSFTTQGVGTATYDELTRTITWIIDYMPKNGMAWLQISLLVNGTGNNTPNLAVNASLYHVDQYDTPNNYKNKNYSIYVAPNADIQINQTQQTSTEGNDQYVTYTITATNNGPDTATGVQITDTLPTGLIFDSYTTTQGSYSNGIWTIGTITNGTTATLTIKAKINTTTGTIKNTATKTGETENDWNYDNNAQTTILDLSGNYTPTVNMYVLQYPWYYDTKAGTYQTKSAYHNTIVYTVDVRNIGPDDASGIIIKEIIGTGYEFLSFTTQGVGTATYDELTRTITWIIDYMPKNGMAWLQISLLVNGTGNNTPNLAVNASLYHVDQYDTPNNYKNKNYSIYVAPNADIQINQTQQTSTEGNDQYVTYTITATNNGPDTATGVQITDTLPTGLIFDSYTTTQGSYSNGIWTIGTITNGTTATLTIKAKINTTTGTIKNTATKTGETENDWNYDNNAQTTILTLRNRNDI
ncbi:Ig-like domain-containing protein [Methanobacterium petrolearium]|uniref:Ig-like domain-containing protein n=1 Tax=Methanobacterium petrolearium TaxID=710190 RepID=UPI0030818740|nr:hypothetical protein GCM10025861_22050 [Methanobacterium petrolearium]